MSVPAEENVMLLKLVVFFRERVVPGAEDGGAKLGDAEGLVSVGVDSSDGILLPGACGQPKLDANAVSERQREENEASFGCSRQQQQHPPAALPGRGMRFSLVRGGDDAEKSSAGAGVRGRGEGLRDAADLLADSFSEVCSHWDCLSCLPPAADNFWVRFPLTSKLVICLGLLMHPHALTPNTHCAITHCVNGMLTPCMQRVMQACCFLCLCVCIRLRLIFA